MKIKTLIFIDWENYQYEVVKSFPDNKVLTEYELDELTLEDLRENCVTDDYDYNTVLNKLLNEESVARENHNIMYTWAVSEIENDNVYILYHLDGRYDDNYKVDRIFSSIPTEEQLIKAGIPVKYHQELLELDEGVQIGDTYELYMLEKRELK